MVLGTLADWACLIIQHAWPAQLRTGLSGQIQQPDDKASIYFQKITLHKTVLK